MKKMFEKLKQSKIILPDMIVVALLLLSSIAYFAFYSDLNLDFSFSIPIDVGHKVIYQDEHTKYAVDQSKMRIIKITDNKVEFELVGDGSAQNFYQAESVVTDSSGALYVHSITWDESGFILSNEKIVKFDSNGNYVDTLYNLDYESSKIVNKHTLFNLRVVEDGVEFISADTKGFKINHVSFDKKHELKSEYSFSDAITLIQNYDVDSASGNIYMADKRGAILCANSEGISTYYQLEKNSKHTPYDVSVGSDGSVYFTDIYEVSINKILKDGSVQKILTKDQLYPDGNIGKNDGLFYTVTINSVKFDNGDNKDVISTIYGDTGIYSVTDSGEVILNQSEFRQSDTYLFREIVAYILVGICIIGLLYILTRGIILFIINSKNIKLIYKIEIIIITMMTIASAISIYALLPQFTDIYTDQLSKNLLSISNMVANTIDTDAIQNINSNTDYMGKDYKKIMNQLNDTLIKKQDEYGILGAQLEKYEDGVGYSIAFPDNSISSYYPLDSYSTSIDQRIYESKEPDVQNMNITGGSFICARTPIFNSDGDVIAVINVGKDNLILSSQVRKLVLDVVTNLILILIIAIFLINEVIAFINQRTVFKKDKDNPNEIYTINNRPIPMHMLKLFIFICAMALNFSSSFLAVYTTKIYANELGISSTIAGTIPLLINAAFIALSALICPIILKKINFRTLAIIGAISATSGDLMIACLNNYQFAVIGLLLNGLGYGILFNSLSTYIGQLGAEKRADGFSRIDSSRTTGVACGTIFGAFLAELIPYNKVFFFSAALWALTIVLGIYLGKYLVGRAINEGSSEGKISSIKFISSLRISSYILLLSIPYTIISSFLYYYVPIYGENAGLSTKQVSLIMILYLMVTIFLATPLTKFAQGMMKKNSVYVAIILSMFALMIIGLYDNIYILLLGLLMLGLASSFGNNVNMTYFLDEKRSKEYGEENALGTYNFLSNLGGSTNFLIFGAILAGGMASGMATLSGVVLGAAALYKVAFDRKAK